MKKILWVIFFICIGVGAYFFATNMLHKNVPIAAVTTPTPHTIFPLFDSPDSNTTIPQTQVIAQNLDTPWGMVFLPDGSLLVTERSGRVRLVDSDFHLQTKPIATITKSQEIGEGGLLGIAISPTFETNHFVYLYYTYSESNGKTLNRVVRMIYESHVLKDERILLDKIPGSANHNGGRIKFGPDKDLYITTGDAENPSQAQQTNALGGKILRITEDGKVPNDNPFHNLIYSYGHRNPQGLAWFGDDLWATEHGRSGIQSGLDELNRIEKGKNYGWPIIQGDDTRVGMERAKINSGSSTWAPAGAAIINNSMYFGGLRGQALYEGLISGNSIVLKEHLKGELGRIRDVIVGPDNMLYITTSNQDGRGTPHENDDKIIRVNPAKL